MSRFAPSVYTGIAIYAFATGRAFIGAILVVMAIISHAAR